ncbi:MAG TPA: NADH-quinone oxidoreductase subunit H, partial [Symbiobacteriaceae bacterium]|nr:NADH-quinone oxidoreductase subunit H [Symbiobacteriaceae bacterium]
LLLLAPLYAGLTRKLRARLQNRQGPPILQPYFDLFKLLGKEERRVSPDLIYRVAPAVTLTGALAAGLFVPMVAPKAPLGGMGDGLVVIYLLTLSAVGTVLAGLASRSPFASAGASREMMLLLVVEPVLAAAFFTLAVRDLTSPWAPSTAFAALAFFLALQAESAKLPFDIAEAETELMGGPFIEYSGPPMALFQLAMMVRQAVLASFFAALFLPWWPMLHAAKVLLVLVVVEVVAVLSPRLRINQAIRFFEGLAVVALAGLLFAAFGL